MILIQFIDFVNQFENEFWFGDYSYFAAINKLKAVQFDLCNLNAEIMTHIIKMYLIQFGAISRDDKTYLINWESLTENLRMNAEYLKYLRTESLLQCNFNDPQVIKSILNLYEALEQARKKTIKLTEIDEFKIKKCNSELGPTPISNILHLLNPKLFIIWDDDIRIKFGFKSNSNEYIHFLIDSKKMMLSTIKNSNIDPFRDDKEIVQDIITFAKREFTTKPLRIYNKKTLAKLIYEYYFVSSKKIC